MRPLRTVFSLFALLCAVAGQVACAATPFAIFSVETDGSNLTKIVADPNLNLGSVDVSPNGKFLAMDSWPASGWDPSKSAIHVCRMDGSGFRKLAQGAMPKWSPSGKLLAFQDYYGKVGSLVVDADGSGAEQVARQAGNPNWVNDSRLVMLEWGRRNFRLSNLETGEESRLSRKPIGDIQHGFAVSHNGKQICFVNGQGPGASLVLVPLDDSGGPTVIHQGDLLSSVDWHPFENVIVFSQRVSDGEGGMRTQLFTIQADDRIVKKVAGQDENAVCQSPCYSPDGKRIYFCRAIP